MNRKMLGIVFGALLACGFLAVPLARADEANQDCELTFSQPIQIPGNQILPAGTYWFTAPQLTGGNSVVQILNADRTKVYATILTNSADRLQESDNPVLKFAQPSPRKPEVLLSWFYPDRLTGHEFFYSPRMESRLSESPRYTVEARPEPVIHQNFSASTGSRVAS